MQVTPAIEAWSKRYVLFSFHVAKCSFIGTDLSSQANYFLSFFVVFFFLGTAFSGAQKECCGERYTIGLISSSLLCVCSPKPSASELPLPPYPFILSHTRSLSFLPSPSPPLLPHWDGLMEIIQKWKETKSPGFTGSLSNHICSSQRRHSSNWGTHFLTLWKGHLLLRQHKHCISFACGRVFYDCGAFFTLNNEGQCPEFLYFILVDLKTWTLLHCKPFI